MKFFNSGRVAAAFLAFFPISTAKAAIPSSKFTLTQLAPRNPPPVHHGTLQANGAFVRYEDTTQILVCPWKPGADGAPVSDTDFDFVGPWAEVMSADDKLIVTQDLGNTSLIEIISADNTVVTKICPTNPAEKSVCKPGENFANVGEVRRQATDGWANCKDIVKSYDQVSPLTPALYDPRIREAVRAQIAIVIQDVLRPR